MLSVRAGGARPRQEQTQRPQGRPSVHQGERCDRSTVEYEGMVLFVGERTVSHPSWITPPSSLDGLFVPVHYVTL